AASALARRRRPLDDRARPLALERRAQVDMFGISDVLHTTGRLDDGSPFDYARGVRVIDRGSDRIQSHGGSWGETAAKLVRLPDRGASFASLAPAGGAEAVMALSSSLEDALLAG
ncbi:MAG: hypothetical protein LH654_00450, partial [Thermoleophilia bacterium]|nr:hypothetical protein [Thermoleophilia bacterium]